MNSKTTNSKSGGRQFSQLRKLVRSRLGDATRESIGALVARLRMNRQIPSANGSADTRSRALFPELISANPADLRITETAGYLVANLSGRIQAAQREFDFLVAERVQCAQRNEPGCLVRLSPELMHLAARMLEALREYRHEDYRFFAARVNRLSPAPWEDDRFNPLGAEVLVCAYLSSIRDSLATDEQRALLTPVLLGENITSLFRAVAGAAEFMAKLTFDSSTPEPSISFSSSEWRDEGSRSPDDCDTNGQSIGTLDPRPTVAKPVKRKATAALSRKTRSTARSAVKMPSEPSKSSNQTPASGDAAVLRAAAAARTVNREAIRGADRPTLPGDPGVLKSIESLEADAVSFAHEVDQIPYSRESRRLFFERIRTTMAGLPCAPSQLSTLDLVAGMFDYVIDDRRVPEAAQPLIWRLQLPVLTMALLDPGYLSDDRRSVRRLLETIGAITSQFGEQIGRGSDAHRRLETSVRAIEIVSSGLSARSQALAVQVSRAFQRCSSGMSQLIDRVGRDLDALEQTPGRQNRRDFAQRPGREEEKQATARLSALIASKIRGLELPASVDLFLQSVWMRYMRTALLREGEQSAQFANAEQLIDDLLWTLNQKSGVGDRRQLAQRIPALIAQVNRGLHEVGAREEDHQAFFDELFLIHLRKLQRLKGHSAQTLTGTATTAVPPVTVTPVDDSLISTVPVLDQQLSEEELAGRASLNEASRLGVGDDTVTASGMPTSRLGPVSQTPGRWASNDDDASEATSPVGGNKLLTMLQGIDLDDLPPAPSYQSRTEAADPSALQAGAWLEYRHSKGVSTYLKIAWLNDQHSVALLVRNPDRRAMSRPVSQLRSLLASGRLRLLRIKRAA
ncbi:MAG: DUF1631 family protein [Burkholderiaceae bacterium]